MRGAGCGPEGLVAAVGFAVGEVVGGEGDVEVVGRVEVGSGFLFCVLWELEMAKRFLSCVMKAALERGWGVEVGAQGGAGWG